MARPKRAHWLDQVILEAKPGGTPKADFDAWRNAHAGAIRRLKQRGARIPRNPFLSTAILQFARKTLRDPLPTLAVAAAMTAGILVLVASRMDREPASVEPPRTAADHAAQSRPETLDPAERELRLAGELFRQNDVAGLLLLLRSDQSRTVFAVAAYLGQIGDLSCLPALQTLADQWQDPSRENPFHEAIDQIRRRHGQSQSEPSKDRIVVIPATTKRMPPSEAGPTRTCRGVVRNKAGAPVGDAKVWAQHCTKDLQLTDVAPPVRTDPQGRFSLAVPTGDSEAGNRIYLLCEHAKYALGWTRLPANPEDSDLDDCRIVLYEPTVVAGTVAEVHGTRIPGAIVEARIVPEHDPTSEQEYPYKAGNRRAVKSDALGQFILGDVPEGSLLCLSVSRPGYASCDSREGSDRLLGTWPFIDPETHTVRAGREDVRIELRRALGRINVQVLDERGNPYGGEVVLRCEDYTTPTASVTACRYSGGGCTLMAPAQRGSCSSLTAGRFRIADLAVGRYLVAAADPRSGDLLTPHASVTLTESKPSVELTLRMVKATNVTVRVKDPTGRPVPNVLVVAESFMAVHRYTDSDGRCILPLVVPGDHPVAAYGWNSDPRTVNAHVGNSAQDRQVEILVRAPVELRGRLVDEFGMPVRGSVRLALSGWVSTDLDGHFTIPKSHGDLYSWGYAQDAEGTRARVFLQTARTKDGELEIRLEPLVSLTGRVLDLNMNPKSDAPVVFWLAPGEAGPIPDDITYWGLSWLRCTLLLSDGRFRLDVPAGRPVFLHVWSDGSRYQARLNSIHPEPGQTYDLGDLLLQSYSDAMQ
jgi:hypothetical protein